MKKIILFGLILVSQFLQSQEVETLFIDARDYVYESDFEKGFKLFDSIRKLNYVNKETLSNVYYWLGFIKRNGGDLIDYEASKEYYLESIKLNPKNSTSYLDLALLTERHFNNDSLALKYMIKSYNLDTLNYSAFFQLDMKNYFPEDFSLKKNYEAIKNGIDNDNDGETSEEETVFAYFYLYLNYNWAEKQDLESAVKAARETIKKGRDFSRIGKFKYKNIFVPDSYSFLADYYWYTKADYEKSIIYSDSAISISKKYGINPVEYYDEQMAINYDNNDFDLYKRNQELSYNLDKFDYSTDNYNYKTEAIRNFKYTDEDFLKFYPFEKLNRKKESMILPLELSLSIDIKDIGKVDMQGERKNDFEILFDLLIESDYDPNYPILSYNGLDTLRFLNYKKYFKFKPYQVLGLDTIFSGRESTTGKFHQKHYNYDAVSKINWDISDFPFDKQKLNLVFDINIDTSLYKLKKSEVVESKYREYLPSLQTGFEIDDIQFKESFERQYQVNRFYPDIYRRPVYSRGTFEIILSRSGGWLFFKLFLGAFLSYIISCLVFLIPKSNFGSRIDLTLGAIFGSVGNKYFVESATSMSQVLTKADLLNNLVIFLVLVNVVIVIMQDNDDIDFKRFENSKFSLIFSICTMIILSSIIILF
jgi:hypothetical protein